MNYTTQLIVKAKIIFLICLLHASLYAGEYLGEVKVGYFRPTDDILRDIFPDGWPNYQLEFSYSPFSRSCADWWRGFFAWGSVNYLHADGRANIGINNSNIKIIPAALGLKYMVPLPCCVQAYISGGLKYFWLHIDSRDEVGQLKDRAGGLGGVAAIGALFHPLRNVFFDFFVDYSFKHFNASNFSIKQNNVIPSAVDISGMTFGIGIGIWF